MVEDTKICLDIEEIHCENLSKKLNEYRHTHVIVIVGTMTIDYLGRAASHAEEAPRLVLVKPDGTLLVHEASKREPLNWQPPGSHVLFECLDNTFRLKSIRTSPHEEILIEFKHIDFVKVCKLATTKLTVIGTEKDLVELLKSNPSIIEQNAIVIGSEISTPYGKIDVLLKSPRGTLIVVEVKNEKAGISAVNQLKRYVEYYREQGYDVQGVLVAPGISKEAYILLSKEGFSFVESSKLRAKHKHGLDRFFKQHT